MALKIEEMRLTQEERTYLEGVLAQHRKARAESFPGGFMEAHNQKWINILEKILSMYAGLERVWRQDDEKVFDD